MRNIFYNHYFFLYTVYKMKIAYAVILTLLLITGLLFLCQKQSKEGFIDVKQSYQLSGRPRQQRLAKAAQLTGHLDNQQFMTRPTYRPDIPPRMYSGSHAGEIRGAMPPLSMQAVPLSPTDDGALFTEMVGANYSTEDNDCLEGYSEDQISEMLYEKYEKPLEYDDPSETLPSEDMSSIKYGKLPSDPESFMYDRMIYVNQKRRNLQGADWIRGDLAIVPDQRGWHDVSVIPHLDLRRGAMGAGHIGPDVQTEVDQYGGIHNDRLTSEQNITVSRYS
jgi:hypothetical protein